MTPEIEEQLEGLLLATGYDDCLLGIAERCGQPNVAAYDAQKVARSLMRQGMSEEEAWEFFYFNISGGYVGELTPVFIHKLCQPKRKAESTKQTTTQSPRCGNASSKKSKREQKVAIRANGPRARRNSSRPNTRRTEAATAISA